MERLIERQRSVIVACDVASITDLNKVVEATAKVPGIGGYKVGAVLALRYGLRLVAGLIREISCLPIIYDHQKAGTDIPQLGEKFAKVVAEAGVDAVILFPFGGAATERDWIRACQDQELTVLVGGHMTQPEFLFTEGGFIHWYGPTAIFRIAVDYGVRDFVVPGNKVEFVRKYRKFLEEKLGDELTLYAPGFIGQGGNITECGEAAGDSWHAIVGSAIYDAEDMTEAAKRITAQIV